MEAPHPNRHHAVGGGIHLSDVALAQDQKMSAIEQVLNWADDVGIDQGLLRQAWAELLELQKRVDDKGRPVEVLIRKVDNHDLQIT